jgi:alpha-pyrone synthase
MPPVYLNRVATAVPTHDVHRKFVEHAPRLLADERARRLFGRMAERAQIEHRYSFVEPDPSPRALDRLGLFRPGAFPDTAARMKLYEAHAPGLAE